MSTRHNVAVLIFDGAAEWQVALALTSLRRYAAMRIIPIGLGPLPILAASGLRVIPEQTLGACVLGEIAFIVIPGGELWERGPMPSVDTFLHRAATLRARIAGIGTGVIPLARAGLLDDRFHASDGGNDGGAWLRSHVPSYLGAAFHVGSASMDDRRIITAASRATSAFAGSLMRASGVVDAEQAEAWRQLHDPAWSDSPPPRL